MGSGTTTQATRPTPPAHPEHPHAGRGILMALLATVSYAVVDTLSKYQAREYPVMMIVWARYFVPLALLLAVFLPRFGTRMLRTAFPMVQMIRGVLLTAGTIFIQGYAGLYRLIGVSACMTRKEKGSRSHLFYGFADYIKIRRGSANSLAI